MLRMILNSHPLIFSGNEMPWLAGNYIVDNLGPEVSLRGLYLRMILDDRSFVKSSHIDKESAKKVFSSFVKNITELQLEKTGKKIWVEKTPDNIIQTSFLHEIFPQAKFIRIVRDGRDVALSTIKVDWKGLHYFIDNKKTNLKFKNLRKSINSRLLYELPKTLQEILLRAKLEPAYNNLEKTVFYPIANTYYNALYRWEKWNQIYENDVERLNINELSIKYEDMLLKPHEAFSKIFDSIGIDWDKNILNYSNYKHDHIQGDTGATSALKFSSLEPSNAYKWKKELTSWQKRVTKKYFDNYLYSSGYEKTI
ncbi:MAG: sulfotransferase [Nitrospirae bacterium]|nr:sulfotransferase [Nitrospirota bacterium]